MFNKSTSSSTPFSFGAGRPNANGSEFANGSGSNTAGSLFGPSQSQPGLAATGGSLSLNSFRPNDTSLNNGNSLNNRFGQSNSNSFSATSQDSSSPLIATIDQPGLSSFPPSLSTPTGGSKLGALSNPVKKKTSSSPLKHSASVRPNVLENSSSFLKDRDNDDLERKRPRGIAHSQSMNFKLGSQLNSGSLTLNQVNGDRSSNRINHLVIKQPSADSPFRRLGTPVENLRSVTPVQQLQNGASPMITTLKKADPKRSALEDGYWVLPPLSKLAKYSDDELKAVSNLMIGRRGFGQISYNQPVDLSGLANLGDILGNLIVFDDRMVCVYPDEDSKAPEGEELNVPAIVQLENCAPKEKNTRKIITDTSNPFVLVHVAKLRSNVEQRGGKFITYDVIRGTWIFEVPHFSTWGIDDEYDFPDMMNDGEAHLAALDEGSENDTFAYRENLPGSNKALYSSGLISNDNENEVIHERQGAMGLLDDEYDAEHGDFSTSDPNALPLTNGFLTAQNKSEPMHLEQPILTHDLISFGDNKPLEFLGNNGVPDEDSDLSNLENESMESDFDDLEVPMIGRKSNDALIKDFDAPESNANAWAQQISNEIFDNGMPDILEEKLLPGSLTKAMFGGIDIAKNTVSHDYLSAAEKLRLPGLEENFPFGSFSIGTDVLICRNSGAVSGACLEHIPYRKHSKNSVALLRQLVNWSRISCNRGGSFLPFAEPTEQLTFSVLNQEFSEGSNVQERKLWELLSILFDDIEELGLEEKLTEPTSKKISERHRRRLLSSWLKDLVAPDTEKELANAPDSLSKIYILISGNQLSEAARLAIDSGNPHLATVIPLLGSNDQSLRSSAKDQLDYWMDHNMADNIPLPILKIYELVSGNSGTSKLPNVDVNEGLNWKKAFGLKLWYSAIDGRSSIAQSVEWFKESFGSDPQLNFTDDVMFKLLDYYASNGTDLAPSLDLSVSQWGLDYRLPWYIYLILGFHTNSSELSEIGDRLTVEYGMQLLGQGFWIESIFVLSHIKSDDSATKYINHALSTNVHKIHDKNNGLENITTLQKDLCIPKKLIYELDALRLRWHGEFLLEAESLLNAEMWEEAHKTIVTKVAPHAIISEDLTPLMNILRDFNYSAVSGWKTGGGLYLLYTKLVGVIGPKATKEPKAGELETIQKAILGLVDSLGEVNDNGSAEANVAISIMSSFACSAALSYTDIPGSKLLRMKMCPNEYLKNTLDLSVTYFKNRD